MLSLFVAFAAGLAVMAYLYDYLMGRK